MEDTNTKITVSSINDINTYNQERIITIAGDVDAISRAEGEISSKLRAAYESDIQTMPVGKFILLFSQLKLNFFFPHFQPQAMIFPGLHPAAMMSTATMGVQQQQQPQQQPHHLPLNGGRLHHPHQGVSHHAGGVGGQPNLGHFQQARPPAASAAMMTMGYEQLMAASAAATGIHHAPGAAAAQHAAVETVFLYVPNGSVGAIIGTKGGHVRNVIKFSGASVKIAQAADDPRNHQQPQQPDQQQGDQVAAEGDGEETASAAAGSGSSDSSPLEAPSEERKVTITGNPESQWKAQYLIFEKLREEGFFSRPSSNPASAASGHHPPAAAADEVRLTVEILVPASQVGRIIGKGGANVRELQKVTGASIKLPEQGSVVGDETPVHINGNFYSVQVRRGSSVSNHIANLVLRCSRLFFLSRAPSAACGP